MRRMRRILGRPCPRRCADHHKKVESSPLVRPRANLPQCAARFRFGLNTTKHSGPSWRCFLHARRYAVYVWDELVAQAHYVRRAEFTALEAGPMPSLNWPEASHPVSERLLRVLVVFSYRVS